MLSGFLLWNTVHETSFILSLPSFYGPNTMFGKCYHLSSVIFWLILSIG
jgi:hypothetical protein